MRVLRFRGSQICVFNSRAARMSTVSTKQLSVATIGLGNMGLAIARNVLKAGYPLTVYNRTADKANSIVRDGAKFAASPKEAASEADVVISVLGGDQSVYDVTTDEKTGIAAGLKKDAVHISVSTISPKMAQTLQAVHKKYGSHYVAAPVLGRPEVAEAGKLRSFVSGHQPSITLVTPLISTYASTAIINLGEEIEKANALKLAANFALVSALGLFGQFYTFTEKYGVQSEQAKQVLDILLPGPIMQGYSEKIRSRSYGDGGADLQGVGLKDVKLMIQSAEERGIALPYASWLHDQFVAAVNMGLGDKDWSAVTEVQRVMSGLK